MKSYTKRIVTWLMAIALLVGTILTDYRVPLLTKADEVKDITGEVTKKLWNFYMIKNKNTIFIVENGVKKSPLPDIVKGDELYLEYQWSIPEAKKEFIKGGNYFDIILPNQSMIKSTDGVEYPVYEKEKPETEENRIGTSVIHSDKVTKKGYVRTTLKDNYDFSEIKELEGGLLTIWAKAVNSGDLDGGIEHFEGGDSLNIHIAPSNPGGGGGGNSNPQSENFPPMRDQQPIYKWGSYSKDRNHVDYTFAINRDEIKKIYSGDVEEKKNIVITDKLPDGLEVIAEDIRATVPFFPPAYDKNTKQLTDITSSAEVLRAETSRPIMDHDIQKKTIRVNKEKDKVLFTLDEDINGEKTWEAYQTYIKEQPKNMVGVWKKTHLIITFKKLPCKYTYTDAFPNVKEEIEKLVDSPDSKKRISSEQKEKMLEVYPDKSIIHYNISFASRVTGGLKQNYNNTVYMNWDEGGSAQAEKIVEIQGVGNTIKPKYFDGSIEVVKEWRSSKKEPITVILQKNGQDTDKKLVLKEDNGWTGRFLRLPEFEQGQKIQYSVKEETAIPGYKSEVVEDSHSYKFTIINTELVTVRVEKKWSPEAEGNLHEEVQVAIYRKGNLETAEQTLTLKKTEGWKGEFKDLPKYDDAGNEIEYIVKEVAVPGYKSEVTGDMKTGFTITNTKAKINIPVEKMWGGFNAGEGPTDVTGVEVELFANGQTTGKILKLNKANQWKGTFENLDVNQNDKPINYSVKERSVKGYTTSIAPKAQDDITKGFVITNTKIPDITITVDKKWVNKKTGDISNKYKKLPAFIEVELRKKSTNEVVDTKKLTKSGGWKTSFKPVPFTDEKGNVIQYEVKEKTEVTGFKVKQNPVAVNKNNNEAVLVNEKEEKFINISVEKKWLDEKGAVKSTGLPEKIVVQIIAKNDQGAVLNNYNRVVELYQNQSWKGSIDVPAETEEGDIIHYSAKEITVLGYLDGIIKPVKEANGNYSFTVTNKEIPKTEIKVTKKWTNENGGVLPDNHKRLLEVSSITVRLIKDGTPTNLTKELKKTDGWETSFTDLPKMKADGTEIVYSVEEIVEPNGFSAVTNPVKAVNGTAVIENRLKPNNIDITVTKKWEGISSGQPEVTLKLVQSINGGAFTDVPNKSIKLPHNGNWNYTFNNLPSEDEFGNEIKYEVREDNIPSGYSRSYDHANYIVTNTKIDKINIEVKKQWLTDNGSTDLPDNYNLIPEQIEVELLANDAPMVPAKKIMLKKSESWTGRFIDLDKTDNQGRLITYTVKETAKQNHFDLAAVADVDDTNNAIIKNIQTKENTTVKITKEWKDKSGNIVAGNIANKVKFELYYDDNGKKITVKNDIVLPTAEGKWEYIQSGLTKYDREGNLIKYQVEEIEVPEGYFKSIKHDNNFNFTATNQEIPKININVEKRWVDKDGEKLPDEYKLIPESLEIKLLANDEAVTYNDQNTVKVLKSNDWKYEFKDLYELDENGEPIKYSVQEILTAKDAKSFVAENPTVQVNNKEALLINEKSDEKVNVSVEKKWKDVSNSDITANLPSKVILKLKKVVNSKDEFIQEIVLPVNGEWKAVIPNLAKYDSRGERIIYKVVEEDVPDGYFVEYGTPTVGENSTSFLVTNRVIPKVDIAVEKEWVNKDGVGLSKDNAQIPDSIRVKLLAGGKATGNIIELKKSEDWKGGFTNLDKKDKSGGDIVYTIEEIMPEKLNETFVVSSKTEPTEVNGYKAVITNKNTDQKVKVKIQKVWTDENGIDITKSIPDNVKLKMEILKYDGKIDGHDAYSPVKQDIEISKATNWSFESELLPKLDKDGNKIEYYVREVEVPDGYRVDSKPIEDPENNTFTFTVTNQIIPKTKMDVEKRWLDKDKKPLDSTYIRIPEKITVRLLANGHPIDVLDILKANDWKGSFTDLPLTDMYHQNITYKVEEVNVPEGFVRSSTTDDNGTVVITNTDAGETVKINVRKIWLDINNNPISNANVLPQFVKFQLLADGVSKGSFYVYKDKGFVWSSENLEKYDAKGKEISYTIKELDGTYGYSLTSINKSSNGLEFTVTNTESPYTPPYIPPYTPFIPDEPVPTPPNIPTPPAPDVPIDELVIEDDEVALADNEEEPEDPSEEITDDLPKVNKNVPKTADYLMDGFANPLAVGTVIMLGYGLKRLVAKKKKD